MRIQYKATDQFAESLTKLVIQNPVKVIVLATLFALIVGSGGRFLEFSNDYRAFFSDQNPELSAFESLQKTYSKTDNILFVLVSNEGDTFSSSLISSLMWSDYLPTPSLDVSFLLLSPGL